MKKLLLLLLPLCLHTSVFSQWQADTHFNAWYMYFGNHRLSDRWGLHTEYQFRRHGLISDWQQSLLRVGADYHVSKKMMVTAGYGWIVSFPYGEQPIAVEKGEHRIWQQLILKQGEGRLNFQHRYRLEQRFLEQASLDGNGDKVVDGYDFRQRARYRLFVSVPINRSSMEENTFFLAAYDEVFLGFGAGTQANVLDQNRLYGGVGWQVRPGFNIQAGYLNHLVFKSDGVHMERNHTLNLGLTYNLDLRPEL